MSIVVDNLTKSYGLFKAIDNISFDVSSGKVTGFLGPNGAGKSTTLKISTGFLKPGSGEVLVEGVSVSTRPLECKRITGYLAENNPLYLDMYVREFLEFIGSSYHLRGKQLSNRIEENIERCGLQDYRQNKIRNLSKGYRQRVGLAQALMGDPKVLMLDEPTSGLDPNQLVEIRNLIKELSREKTVLMSTHIMQEVEAICDDVVIIHRGSIVANSSLKELRKTHSSEDTYEVAFETSVDATLFDNDIFSSVDSTDKVVIIRSTDQRARKMIMEVVQSNDLPLTSLNKLEYSLEEVFHQLTAS